MKSKIKLVLTILIVCCFLLSAFPSIGNSRNVQAGKSTKGPKKWTTATAAPSTSPTASPVVTVPPTATPVVTVPPTATPIVTVPPTAVPTPTVSPTATPSVTVSPTISPTAVPTEQVTGSNGHLVGYYAAWAKYSGFTPDKLDAAKLTHINYAFANIGSDNKIALGYPDIDLANFAQLNTLKQANPNLKTIIAVGGWTWSGRFSDVALTEASRTAFADSCVDFIVTYGFDGVDIDWEYPVAGGLSTNIKRPEDKYNFTLLMKTLREKLDARGAMDGKKYILSFAGASGTWYINNVQLSELSKYVDYANIMTYDYHGTWEAYTDFNAPIYSSTECVDTSIQRWINAGFAKNKIIMGVPFYGYIYRQVANINNGLNQTYSGGASISYANIAANYLNVPEYKRFYHATAKVPWLFNGSTFITYEDEESMLERANYVKINGLGGAMIWELSQDPNRVLFNALYDGLRK